METKRNLYQHLGAEVRLGFHTRRDHTDQAMDMNMILIKTSLYLFLVIFLGNQNQHLPKYHPLGVRILLGILRWMSSQVVDTKHSQQLGAILGTYHTGRRRGRGRRNTPESYRTQMISGLQSHRGRQSIPLNL